MTPDQERKLNEVYRFVQQMKRQDTIPLDVERGLRYRLNRFFRTPDGLRNAPLTSVTSPTGGATVDTQARASIDALITRMEDLGLITTN